MLSFRQEIGKTPVTPRLQSFDVSVLSSDSFPTHTSADCRRLKMGPKYAGAKGGSRIKKEGQPDVYRIGGQEVPYDPELEYGKPKPTPLYPVRNYFIKSPEYPLTGIQKYKVTTPKPPTETETIQIARFRALRESIHNGPLYTILGENVRVTKPGEKPNKPAASFNAFEGMPKYSQRYTKKSRMIPKLDTRPYGKSSAPISNPLSSARENKARTRAMWFTSLILQTTPVLKFFPKELHSTLDPSTATTTHTTNGTTEPSSSSKHKILTIPGYEKATEDAEASGDEGEEKAPRDPDEDDPLMGEEVDDAYDDEDEDGGDYNAEQYFDDGGDDGGEDYDGGGDDGGGGYID